MKVAILGAGTAGFMAATHLSRHFPEIELIHIFDPKIGTIGVGEGTTPGFRSWLAQIAPVEFKTLKGECYATEKRGIRFENWGKTNELFYNDFFPRDRSGLHISAAHLVTFLSTYVNVDPTAGHVTRLEDLGDSVVVEVAGAPSLTVDLVIDARGFPRVLDPTQHLRLNWIPTNAALVTAGPPVDSTERTRAVARSHGWVFVIPLTQHTSYGYVCSEDCVEIQEVENDFSLFLKSESVARHDRPRCIRFPNFVCREPFQGRVCKIGNAASFIEPLEATSIAVVKAQLELLTPWLRLSRLGYKGPVDGKLVAHISGEMRELVLELSLFVAWHYGMGSTFETRFWELARSRFQQGLLETASDECRRKFDTHMKHASQVPVEKLDLIQTSNDLDHVIPEHVSFPKPFGGMSPIGFAQLSRGIGDVDRLSIKDSLAPA